MAKVEAKKQAIYNYPAINGRSVYRTWFQCVHCGAIYCRIIEFPVTLLDLIRGMPCQHGHARSDVQLITENDGIEQMKQRYEIVAEEAA